METNNNNNEKNTLPEYIQGIPTAKYRSRERRSLIAQYYSNLWKQLQRMGKNWIFHPRYKGRKEKHRFQRISRR